MTTELIETAIPTQISFKIGNTEISNLLVQNEVIRIEGEIAALNLQADGMTEEFKSIMAEVKASVIADASELWAERLWTVADISEQLVGRPMLSREKWDLVFEWEPLWLFASTDRNGPRDPKSISVKVSFQKEERDGISYLTIPIGWHSDGDIPYELKPEVELRVVSGQNLYGARTEVFDKIKKLTESIADTSKIEKRVLAALTQNSIANNPELVAQLQGVVTMIGSDQLLLTAS
jgi:hypothetical protein